MNSPPRSNVTRPRVLVLAEAANPERTSVPLIGYNLAVALRCIADVHLVTQVRNRAALQRAGWQEGRDFTAIDSEPIARRVYAVGAKLRGGAGKGWTMMTALKGLSYRYFEKLAWRRFCDELAAGRFDLVHRITPVSPTIPSPIGPKLSKLGVPFVLGPLNGGLPWPREFDHARRAESEWLSYLRPLHKLAPGYHATRRSASRILIGSRATWQQMPRRYRYKCLYIPENAIDPTRFPDPPARPSPPPLKAVFVGRLVPYKGADMLLDAAAGLLASGAMTLKIVGDGPMRGQLEQQARSLEIDHAVTFTGWLDHTRVHEALGEAHVFPFPSIREFGGAVVLEAMAMGAVPVVVDYGGPGELVNDETGYRVSLSSPVQLVRALQQTLKNLVQQPANRLARSRRAQMIARERFSWDAKAARISGEYDRVICAKGADRQRAAQAGLA